MQRGRGGRSGAAAAGQPQRQLVLALALLPSPLPPPPPPPLRSTPTGRMAQRNSPRNTDLGNRRGQGGGKASEQLAGSWKQQRAKEAEAGPDVEKVREGLPRGPQLR